MKHYFTKQEVFEHEILPWIEDHKTRVHSYGEFDGKTRTEVNWIPPLPNEIEIDLFDKLIERIIASNKMIEKYKTPGDQEIIYGGLTSNNLRLLEEAVYYNSLFSAYIPHILTERYGNPVRKNYRMSREAEWEEITINDSLTQNIKEESKISYIKCYLPTRCENLLKGMYCPDECKIDGCIRDSLSGTINEEET